MALPPDSEAVLAAEELMRVAAGNGNTVVLTSLLDGVAPRIRIDAADASGYTALIEAVIRHRVEAVRLLIDRGASVNQLTVGEGHTALHFCAKKGFQDVVSLLLDAGANPSIQDAHGVTPLIFAANWGQLAMVRRLIEESKGDDVINARDEAGRTALFLAVSGNHSKVVTALILEGGADPTIPGRLIKRPTKKGPITPLEYATLRSKGCCIEVLKWWECEHERLETLDKARFVSEECRAVEQHLTYAAVPAYLRGRVMDGMPLPQLHLTTAITGTTIYQQPGRQQAPAAASSRSPRTRGGKRGREDEEIGVVLGFVLLEGGLSDELYQELQEGLAWCRMFGRR